MGKPALVLLSEVVRAARALLRWEQRDLAEASLGIAANHQRAWNSQPGAMAAHMSTVSALRKALEAAGSRVHRRKRRWSRSTIAKTAAKENTIAAA